jgi:hypothetical protein
LSGLPRIYLSRDITFANEKELNQSSAKYVQNTEACHWKEKEGTEDVHF